MKAVVTGITGEELNERRRKGQDRLDEMWEGVLHMAPAPTWDHQDFLSKLSQILREYVDRHGLGRLAVQANVRDPDAGGNNFRVPDLVFVRAERASIIGRVYVDGGPDAVIEVLSPDDETYDKMPFYEKIGTRWLIVVNPAATKLEVYRLAGTRFVQQAANDQGWIRCDALETAWRLDGGMVLRLERDGREERVR